MGKTMRARYDVPTGEVQIFMSLTEFENLLGELNAPKVKDQLRTVGIVGEWFRGMADSLMATISRAGNGNASEFMTVMTGWWHTPNRS